MGLFSFIKGVGEKVFGHKETPEERQQKVVDHLTKFGLLQPGVTVAVDEHKVTLSGQVDSLEARKRLIATVANIEGVESVDDQLIVVIKEQVVAVEKPVEQQFYQVKPGDNLSKISKEVYGDANKYNAIFEANKPMLTDVDKIYPGQTLVIPDLA
jgi:nucleoid-associated protein YgaU